MGDSVAWFTRYIGSPYKWGGTDSSGYDCLTLILSIFKDRYGLVFAPEGELRENWEEYDRDRYWRETLRHGRLKPQIGHVCEGDVVFFVFKGYPSHAGYMVDKHRFIHLFEKDMVRLDYLNKHPWKTRFWGAVRIANT